MAIIDNESQSGRELCRWSMKKVESKLHLASIITQTFVLEKFEHVKDEHLCRAAMRLPARHVNGAVPG
jgi:hypothetical protein